VNADSVEIVHGVPDRGRDPAVVAIDIASEGLCSGTLIADNAVLTARHCVAKTAERIGCPSPEPHVLEDRLPSSLRVFAGEQLPNLQFVATGRKIVAPPGASLCDADIAVLLLDRRVTGIQPLGVSERGVAQGDHVRAVGFGRRGDSASAGTKLLRDHVPVVATSAAEFLVGEATCSGDSGGPAIDEESGRIVGVISRGGPTCEGKEVHNVYTRADTFLGLLRVRGLECAAPGRYAEAFHAAKVVL